MRTAAYRIAALALAAVPVLVAASAGQWPSPSQVEQRIAAIAASGAADDIVLCRTAGGRDVHLLRIGPGSPLTPAVFIAGGVDARSAYSTELALRIAELLVQRTAEPQAAEVLARCTFYILPQPSPDAAAHMGDSPTVERATNDRPSDDDRDGELDEDGPEDLNGDGVITMMRVADPTGGWRAHPLDSRVLIAVKPELGELGEYALYVEGVDNDQDERWNEDGPGGVDFNRNFSYGYPYFAAGAGPHQISEPETRALADWLWDHPQVAAVITLGGEDNLLSQWEAQTDSRPVFDPGGADGEEQDWSGYDPQPVSKLQAGDAGYYKLAADRYKELMKAEGQPASGDGNGGLLKWAYYHFGRWAFGTQPWWVPEAKKEEKKDEGKDAAPAMSDAGPAADGTSAPAADPPETAPAGETKPKWDEKDKRGKPELDALAYFAANGIDGFANWTPIAHPDFPGKQVEVGGFKPYSRVSPSPAELDALAGPQLDFALAVAGMLPRVAIADARAEALGGGVYRITAKVANLGTLPTLSEMGVTSYVPYPLQLSVGLPAGAELVSGRQRQRLPRLDGGGGSLERTWVVRASGGMRLTLTAESPTMGSAEAVVELP